MNCGWNMESGRQFGRQAAANLPLARNRCCRHTGRHTMPAQGPRACPCSARRPAPGDSSIVFTGGPHLHGVGHGRRHKVRVQRLRQRRVLGGGGARQQLRRLSGMGSRILVAPGALSYSGGAQSGAIIQQPEGISGSGSAAAVDVAVPPLQLKLAH